MQKFRINVIKEFNTKLINYKKLKRYWKVLLKKEFELNGVEFYRHAHYKKLTDTREILRDLLSMSNRLETGHCLYEEVPKYYAQWRY